MWWEQSLQTLYKKTPKEMLLRQAQTVISWLRNQKAVR